MGAQPCWTEGHTPQRCCDQRKGMTGDALCWAGNFSFDACCLGKVGGEAVANTHQDAPSQHGDCWTDGHTLQLCCDTRKGSTGDDLCWSGSYSYETCCLGRSAKVLDQRASNLCWSDGHTPQQCCDTRKGLKGDELCWAGKFSFETCCV